MMAPDIPGETVREGLFQTLLMNANVWISFLDENARIRIWNRAAEEISGYTAEEVAGSNEIWKRLYPDPGYRRQVTDTIDEILTQKKELENFETTIRTKSGGTRTISWNTAGIADAGGQATGYIVLGRDITDKVSLNRQFRVLLMNANVWISFLDENARIRIWNRAAEEISGYTAEEVAGSNEIWKRLYPDPGYRRQVTDTIDEILTQKKELESFQTGIRTKGGDKRIISWNTREIVDEAGRIDGYIMVGIDVTREKEMQEEIFSYIGESAMRLKNPVELIRDSLSGLAGRVASDEISDEDLILALRVQQKSADQIVANLRELNEMASLSFSEMPDALKGFIRR
ncbi:MAG: PAS domain-containing protein [Methanomicrobiales archaeon]